jgi:peptidoglycan hydrolase-like protein with peptidoglycan-binding domain
MMKRTLLTMGLSAMLAMPMLAVGQGTSTTPGTSGGMGSGGSSSGSRMEQRGQQEMSPEQIRAAQKALKEAGFYQGNIDGIAGERTTEAIRDYQKARGLPVTGQLDEPTKELLMAGQPPGGTGTGRTGSGGSSMGGSSMGGPGSGGSSGSATGGSGMGSSGTGGTGSGSSGMCGSNSGGSGTGSSSSGR